MLSTILKSINLTFQEKNQEIDFQEGGYGRQLGCPIGTILAIFDLQVILMLPTTFQVNCSFSSGEDARNILLR